MSEPVLVAKPMQSLMPTTEQRSRLRRIRQFKDKLSRYGVMSAGLAVVFSLGLIFFYLFSEIAPLFRGASVDITHRFTPVQLQQLEADPTEYLILERYEEIGASFKRSGAVNFFAVNDGSPVLNAQVPRAEGATFTRLATSTPDQGLIAYGYSNGQVALTKVNYALSYPQDKRQIVPSLVYPLGDAPLQLDEQGSAISQLAVQDTSSGILMGALTADKRLLLGIFSSNTNMITGEETLNQDVFTLPALPEGVTPVAIQVDESAQHLIIADDNAQLWLYNIINPSTPVLQAPVTVPGGKITAMEFLVGTASLVIGTDQGQVSQWFLVRNSDNVYEIKFVRAFDSLAGAVIRVVPEHARRGFWASDDKGNIGIYYGTSERTLLLESLADKPITQIAVSPIHHRVLLLDDSNQLAVGDV